MTRYLLDTSVLIDFSKGRQPAKSRVLEIIAGGDEVGLCPVNVAEFYTGISLGQEPNLDEFITALDCWEVTFEDGLTAGEYRWQFAKEGKALSTADVLIAAVARRQRAAVVTGNAKDYPMADIEILPLG
jgi:predicted nucleic acid-binding protein